MKRKQSLTLGHVPKNCILPKTSPARNTIIACVPKIQKRYPVEFFSTLTEAFDNSAFTQECILFVDRHLRIRGSRAKAKMITGYSCQDFRSGMINLKDLFLSTDIKRLNHYFQSALRGQPVWNIRCQLIPKHQAPCEALIRLDPTQNRAHAITGVKVHLRKIPNPKSQTQGLKFLSSITQQISDSIIVTDLNFRMIFVNQATEKLYGYSREELLGKAPEFLNAEPIREKIQRKIYRTVRKKNIWVGQHHNRRKDGTTFLCEFKISAMTNAQDQIYCYCSIQRDITDREESQREIKLQRDLGRVLSSTHQLDEALRCVLDVALVIPGLDCGGIYLVDEQTKGLDLVIHRGLSKSFISKVSHFDQTQPQARLVLSGKTFYGSYPNLLKKQSRENGKRREGLQSLAVVPICFDNRVIAALNLGSHQHSEIPRNVKGRIESIASQAGGVLMRLRAEHTLKENFHFLQLLFETSPNPIFLKDARGIYRSCNQAFAGCFQKKEKDILGKTVEAIASKSFAELDIQKDRELIKEKKRQTYESRIMLADGLLHDIMFFKAPRIGPQGRIEGIVGFMLDITKRKEIERESQRSAYHDSLTNIPNRRFFMKSLTQAIQRARRNRRNQFGVLFLDLDHFKDINDGLGHLSGDKIILDISRKLQQCLRANDTVARFGGDEFAILLDSINGVDDAIDAAHRIQIMFMKPIALQGREFVINASIGILMYSPEYCFPEEMLRDVDIAMYRAKLAGRARYAIFDETMHALALRRVQLEGDLRRAIENDELKLRYQPIIALATGQMTGMEALLRWRHPQQGFISPCEFIPLAEETGIIASITQWVLKTAAQQIAQWNSQGYQACLSVNLSASDLAQVGLSTMIEDIFRQNRIAPSSLEFEITETAAMKEIDLALSTLHRLNSLGVRISIDDFGIGHSPLLYLKRFPVSKVKIDISFIRDIPHDSNDAAITHAIISMAHALGIGVVAEGVETAQQLLFLKKHQCNEMQGFLFSRAVEPKVIEAYLAQRTCFFA